MRDRKRIVVTGMGVVTCFGDDVDLFYQNLLQGKSGISKIDTFPCEEYSTKIAGIIRDFSAEGYVDKKGRRRLDPYLLYAIVAAKKALESAKLEGEKRAFLNKERCGIVVSSGMGGMTVFVNGVNTLREKGARRISPFFVPYILTNMGGALLAIDLGFEGPNYSVSTACATGNYALIEAASHIRNNEADLMICGGAEAAIMPMGLAGFCACKALSERNDEPEKASRPWDRDRDGFVLGEGAGVLILEDLQHALARKAPIFAEYLGGGISCDAHHITEPSADGRGIVRCVEKALEDANLRAEDIHYINAHATSTIAGDLVEVDALKKVFKEPKNIFMNATKSMIGHCLGAAAGIEAIVTVKTLNDQVVHPTLNLENPEKELAFRIPLFAEKGEIQYAISNSFGFGGHNATVVFGHYPG